MFGLPHLLLSGRPEPVQRSRSDSRTLRVAGLLIYSTRPTTAHCTEEGRHYTQALHTEAHGSLQTYVWLSKCVDSIWLLRGQWNTTKCIQFYMKYLCRFPLPLSLSSMYVQLSSIFFGCYIYNVAVHIANHIVDGLKVLKNSRNLSNVSEVVKM